jgi:hypothetical protein
MTTWRQITNNPRSSTLGVHDALSMASDTRVKSMRAPLSTDYPNHLILDRCPYIGPLISRWELDKFKNCWNKSFRTSKIMTLLYQKFLNLVNFLTRYEWSKIRGTVQ